MLEVTIKVSNSERSLTQKHLLYQDDVMVSKGNDELSAKVEKAIEIFADEVDDVVVKTRMDW